MENYGINKNICMYLCATKIEIEREKDRVWKAYAIWKIIGGGQRKTKTQRQCTAHNAASKQSCQREEKTFQHEFMESLRSNMQPTKILQIQRENTILKGMFGVEFALDFIWIHWNAVNI